MSASLNLSIRLQSIAQALENGKKLSDFAVGDAATSLQESRALCSQASDEPAGDANTERDPNTGDMFDAEDAAA